MLYFKHKIVYTFVESDFPSSFPGYFLNYPAATEYKYIVPVILSAFPQIQICVQIKFPVNFFASAGGTKTRVLRRVHYNVFYILQRGMFSVLALNFLEEISTHINKSFSIELTNK